VVFLGLAPLAYIRNHTFTANKSWLVRRAFAFVYRNTLGNRYALPFQGHELHKCQFRGVTEQTYFAFNTRPALPRLVRLLRVCNFI
jgi:hypothetical protein